MNKKVLSVFFALVLVLGFSLVPAVPAAAAVSSATVAIEPATAETAADYTIGFGITESLEIGNCIRITFPTGTALGAITSNDVTVNTVVPSSVSLLVDTLSLVLSEAVVAGPVVVEFAGENKIVNPTVGDYTLFVLTTWEETPVESETYNIYPEPSTYVFEYTVPDPIVVKEDIVVPVTFRTDVVGDVGYDAVIFSFAKTGPGDVTFKATDFTDPLNPVEYTFTNSGHWGPLAGFPLPEEYDETVLWTLNFSAVGAYLINFQCGNVPPAMGDPFASGFEVITVLPGAAASIAILPDTATLTAGDTQAYNAEAFDAYANSLGDVTASTIFTMDLGAGGSWEDNIYTSEVAGGWTVTGTYEALEDTATLTVTLGAAASIVISSEAETITAGDTQAYNAEAFDAYANSLGDVTASTTFTIDPGAGGSWADNVYTSHTAGTWTVTGTYEALEDTATLTVTPATKAALAFVQQPTDTVAGEAISPAVTVAIVDEFGNQTLDEDEITIGCRDPLFGTVAVNAVAGLATFNDLSIDKVGVGYIVGASVSWLSFAKVSDAFDITPAAAANIVVTADPTSIAVEGTSAITATVTDAYGNLVADETAISFATTLGVVTPVTDTTTNGVAETTLTAGSFSGTATVTATARGASGETTVEFTAAVIDNITIGAEPMFIPADGSSESTITVTLVDEHGNTVPTAGATVHLGTTAGALDPESGVTVAGVFTSTLTSSFPPTTATVSADVGGMFSGSVAVVFRPLLEPGQIGLVEGWNLISLPLIPEDPTILTVLDGVDVVKVAGYSPFQDWKFYAPGSTSNLDQMNDGWGYWVDMGTTTATLTISGYEHCKPAPAMPPSYVLVEGWNLIGFKSLSPIAAGTYLDELEPVMQAMYGYDAASDVYTVIATGTNLVPGKGYWLAVSEAGTIYP